MRIRHKAKHLFLIVLCTAVMFLQTGCWSKDEIEDQSIYVGMGLDPASESRLEKQFRKEGSDYRKRKLLTYTLQIINVQSENQRGGGQTASSQKPYYNISETGDSMFQLIREFSTRMERPVIGHHLKVIVINERLARKYSMNELLDFSCAIMTFVQAVRCSLAKEAHAVRWSLKIIRLSHPYDFMG